MIERPVAAAIAICMLLLIRSLARAEEQEAVMDEIVVESTFEIDFRLELPKQSAVQIMIDRLTVKEEAQRALDLEVANRSTVTKLLDLTKYSPIPLFGTQTHGDDPFFRENYMRADLNPRDDSPLFETNRRRDH